MSIISQEIVNLNKKRLKINIITLEERIEELKRKAEQGNKIRNQLCSETQEKMDSYFNSRLEEMQKDIQVYEKRLREMPYRKY